jgi:hypothetical protein
MGGLILECSLWIVYILHGYFHWRLFSCVLLGVAAHPSQCIKCCNYHLYSFHRSLFRCDLVEGSQDQELFIAGVVLSWKQGGSSTCLLSSESLQLQSGCALVGVGVAHLSQYVELRAPLWLVTGGAAIATAHVSTVERAFCFWGESLCCMFYIHLHSDIIPLTIISVVPFYRKSWVQLASSWLIAGINEWLLSSESFQLCCGGSNTSSLAKPHDHLWWMTLR